MKNMLSSKTLNPQIRIDFMASVFSVLFVFLCSTFSFASTLLPNDTIQIKKMAEIYISGNAVIRGSNHLSNSNIVSIEATENKSSKIKIKILAKTEDHTISEQVIKKEKEAKEKFAKLQKQVKENATIFITQNLASSDFNTTSSQNRSSAVVVSNFYSLFKFLKAIQEIAVTQKCILERKKQKFYTSLSYVHFGKYRNSSLRAPPFYFLS